jgi:hypothetical protein
MENFYTQKYADYLNQEDLWGVNPQKIDKYVKLLCQEYHLLKDIGDNYSEIVFENNQRGLNFDYLMYEPNGSKNKVLVDYFFEALKVNKKNFFLTPYSKKELENMFLFKVRDLDAGFAIKETEDRFGEPTRDIVAVHNNSDVKRIGPKMVLDAIKKDGQTLDHFDGFLSGLYNDLGFGGYHSDEWADEYAPKDWDYKPLDIRNKTYHADKIGKYSEDEFRKLKNRYDQGKPDVVYRRYKK